jgi:hypothetical protein
MGAGVKAKEILAGVRLRAGSDVRAGASGAAVAQLRHSLHERSAFGACWGMPPASLSWAQRTNAASSGPAAKLPNDEATAGTSAGCRTNA